MISKKRDPLRQFSKVVHKPLSIESYSDMVRLTEWRQRDKTVWTLLKECQSPFTSQLISNNIFHLDRETLVVV